MNTPVKNAVLHNNVTQEHEIVDVTSEGTNQYGFKQGHITTPQGIVHVWLAKNGIWYVSSGYAMSVNGVTRYWNGKTK